MSRSGLLLVIVAVLHASSAAAQQRPLETQDPDTIGAGQVLVETGLTFAGDAFYPLSGLRGNLWQLPVIGLNVGVSAIADLQITGGPYDRLSITGRSAAPLAGLVTTDGASTHAVDDLAIGAKILLLPESSGRPGLGFRFSVRLPNAKHESGLGQDTTDFSTSLLAGKTVHSLRAVGNVGFTIMSEPLDPTKQNDVLTYGLSLTRPATHQLDLVADLNGRASMRNGVAPVGTESRGTVTVGGRYTRGATRFDAAAFFGLTAIDPTIGVKIGVTYVFTAFSLAGATRTAPTSDVIRVGLTPQAVIRILGQPDFQDSLSMTFGDAHIYFTGGRVSSWFDPSHRLKTR